MSASSSNGTEAAERRVLELLRGHERFLLTGHVRPDGDCLGAQAALWGVLRQLGKEVRVLNPDPIQAQFDYLAREVEFAHYQGGALPPHDVVVLLDGSELSRCGALEEPLRQEDSLKLVIDHHIHIGPEWWDAAWIDVTASATGLLVRRIADGLGVELPPVSALGIFTSIVTDTGWFKYSNTDAETLAVASDLVRAGVSPDELFRAIFQRQAEGQPRAIARVLERLEYHLGGRVAVADFPLPRDGEPDLADSDEVLDILRAVRSVEVVLFLRELPDGSCKLSARSKLDYPVNELARRFGGGGHAKAAGATLPGPLAEARRRLLAAVLEDLAPEDGR